MNDIRKETLSIGFVEAGFLICFCSLCSESIIQLTLFVVFVMINSFIALYQWKSFCRW